MSSKLVIIVGIDSDEEPAGYCVIGEDALNEHDGDLFSLFYNDGPGDTFDNWPAALAHVKEAEGELVDVIGALAY